MAINRWDHWDVAVECNDCGLELARFSNAVDATNAALAARWKVHTPTYDAPVYLERTFECKPFYREDSDGGIELTDLEEYARLLRAWGAFVGEYDPTGMPHLAWLDHLEGKLEMRLEHLADDPVWAGDCWCTTCKTDQ